MDEGKGGAFLIISSLTVNFIFVRVLIASIYFSSHTIYFLRVYLRHWLQMSPGGRVFRELLRSLTEDVPSPFSATLTSSSPRLGEGAGTIDSDRDRFNSRDNDNVDPYSSLDAHTVPDLDSQQQQRTQMRNDELFR